MQSRFASLTIVGGWLALVAATYPCVPPSKAPTDWTQRPATNAGTLVITCSYRAQDGTILPNRSQVRIWPADAYGDSIAADRRMYDGHSWGHNFEDRAAHACQWVAWPDTSGVATFPRLPNGLDYYYSQAARVDYVIVQRDSAGVDTLRGSPIKCDVGRVTINGTTVVSLEEW